MIHYEESTHMTNVTPAELSKAEAKKLTKKIKEATDHLWYLLVDAHEGKAWKALGYPTWEAYVQAEFGMSKRRADQLLEKGEVVEAIQGATGKTGNAFPISKRDVDAVKDDLPAVTADIRAKVDAGQAPEEAVAETIAAKRAEKEQQREARKAEQAEWDRQQQENAAALPSFVADRDAARAQAIAARSNNGSPGNPLAAGLTAEDRIAELMEANASLEREVEELRAENKLYREMKAEFEQGGFAAVIAGRDSVIEAQKIRIESESQEKVRNLRSADKWRKIAIELGYTSREVIEIDG